ncbi:MAG: hypothetical protein LBE86_13880 [Gemmobacter sp.]|jgi:hypothetical protein|nr:hypothetical protein [Gemmobacter sp.]
MTLGSAHHTNGTGAASHATLAEPDDSLRHLPARQIHGFSRDGGRIGGCE